MHGDSVLVGCDEEIPGIIGTGEALYRLPMGIKDDTIEIEQQKPIYIKSIEFMMPKAVEERLIKKMIEAEQG